MSSWRVISSRTTSKQNDAPSHHVTTTCKCSTKISPKVKGEKRQKLSSNRTDSTLHPMFYGGGNGTIVNNSSQPLTSDFVSLPLNQGPRDRFVLKGGDATKGRLDTIYDGQKARMLWGVPADAIEGAIILGSGCGHPSKLL